MTRQGAYCIDYVTDPGRLSPWGQVWNTTLYADPHRAIFLNKRPRSLVARLAQRWHRRVRTTPPVAKATP